MCRCVVCGYIMCNLLLSMLLGLFFFSKQDIYLCLCGKLLEGGFYEEK